MLLDTTGGTRSVDGRFQIPRCRTHATSITTKFVGTVGLPAEFLDGSFSQPYFARTALRAKVDELDYVSLHRQPT